MKRNRYGLGAAVTGVILQMAGLAIDALVHSRHPHLALEESLFTLRNPGHAVFALGLVLATVGVGILLLTDRGPLMRRSLLLRTVPMLVVGALGLATAFIALGTVPDVEQRDPAGVNAEQLGHAAPVGAVAPSHASTGASAPPGSPSPQENSRHEHGPEVNISQADIAKLHEQLQLARQATEKYRDINVARAEGYVQTTQDLPRLGAHFVKPSLVDDVFDPAQPESLLYTRRLSGTWELVGVMYLTPPGPNPPEGFAGPLDVWHYHTNLCFVGRVVVGRTSAEDCAARGGRFRARTGWMLHVWLYLDSPNGLFSAENPLLQERVGGL